MHWRQWVWRRFCCSQKLHQRVKNVPFINNRLRKKSLWKYGTYFKTRHFALCAGQIGLQYNISNKRLMIHYFLFIITHLKIHRILIELKLEIFLLIFIVQYASKMSIVLPWNGIWMHFMPLLVQNYRVKIFIQKNGNENNTVITVILILTFDFKIGPKPSGKLSQ